MNLALWAVFAVAAVILASWAVLWGVSRLKFYGSNRLRERFRTVFKNHKIYDLRTTFFTRCCECGVADVARAEFAGHSLGKLADAYTDLSDEFLLNEGQKLNYD